MAIALYSKICKVKGDDFNEDFLNESNPKNPSKFNPVEYEHKLLESKLKTPHYRRSGKLLFYKAYLILPKTHKKVVLVSLSKKDPVSDLISKV